MNSFDRNINMIGSILQLLSYNILINDFNNIDLMSYLQHQDNDYLKEIIKQNKQIIEYLKKGEK